MRRLRLNPIDIPAPVALVALLLVVFGPLLIALNVTLSNSPEVYIPPDSSLAVFERELRERFPTDEVLAAAFAGEGIYGDEFLDGLDQLVEAMQRHPFVERVLAPSTMDHISGTVDGFSVELLLDADARAPLSPSERRERLLSDRFAEGFLISADGDIIAIAVRAHPLENSLQRLSIQNTFHDELRRAEIEGFLVAVSGQTPLDTAQLLATLRDTLIFVPVTLALGLALVTWLFRRWLAVMTAMAVITAAVSTSIAFLVLQGHPFTLITAILPPLMVALSIALLVHWLNAVTLASRRGLRGQQRISWAWEAIRKPALFTALTTAVGLLSLSISTIPPIRALGQAAAVGVVVQYLFVVWLLPPIFARWDRGDWVARGRGVALLDTPVAWLRTAGMRYPLWVLSITAILLAMGVPRIATVEVETDLFRFFKEDHPISQANRLFKERISGIVALEVVFDAPYRDAFKEARRLRQIQDFRDWAVEQNEVDRVISVVDMIEEMHWGFHAEDPVYRALPDQDALIAQYVFIYDGADLYELVDRDFQTTRVLLNLNVNGSRAINTVIADVHGYLDRLTLDGTTYRTAGFARMFGDQERLLIQGQIRGLITAVLLIFLLMAILWRSFFASLLCMIPNLSPIMVIFIVMGLFGIWLDMATAMIAGVAVGIAVDDTIHVYHGYRRRRRAGGSHVWAMARTYQNAGRAVTATTLILGAQFLVMAASDFVPIMAFGLLTALGLVTALIFDLLVLPALLTVWAGWRQRRGFA